MSERKHGHNVAAILHAIKERIEGVAESLIDDEMEMDAACDEVETIIDDAIKDIEEYD